MNNEVENMKVRLRQLEYKLKGVRALEDKELRNLSNYRRELDQMMKLAEKWLLELTEMARRSPSELEVWRSELDLLTGLRTAKEELAKFYGLLTSTEAQKKQQNLIAEIEALQGEEAKMEIQMKELTAAASEEGLVYEALKTRTSISDAEATKLAVTAYEAAHSLLEDVTEFVNQVKEQVQTTRGVMGMGPPKLPVRRA